VWTHYFNGDGDANFNVVLDPPYKNMLGPGSYSQVFANHYGSPALHMEVVCQGPLQIQVYWLLVIVLDIMAPTSNLYYQK